MYKPVQGGQHALKDSRLVISVFLNAPFSSLQVVNRIREVPHRTRLLVVDRETDDHLRSRGLACTEDLAIEMGTLSPRPSPRPTPSSSPIPREISPPSSKPNHIHHFLPPAADSPTHMIKQGKVKRPSVTSSTATDTEVRVEISTKNSSFWSLTNCRKTF